MNLIFEKEKRGHGLLCILPLWTSFEDFFTWSYLDYNKKNPAFAEFRKKEKQAAIQVSNVKCLSKLALSNIFLLLLHESAINLVHSRLIYFIYFVHFHRCFTLRNKKTHCPLLSVHIYLGCFSLKYHFGQIFIMLILICDNLMPAILCLLCHVSQLPDISKCELCPLFSFSVLPNSVKNYHNTAQTSSLMIWRL